MNKLTAELLHQIKSAAQEEIMCREASDTSDAWQDLASPENILLLVEIALPVLEQQESKDVFIVVRKPGHLPYIKRPVGDIADYLTQIYQHNPSVSCDVVTYRFSGASGQWVQDGKELLAELEVPQPTTDTYRQIENDGYIEWGGDCGPYHKPVDGSVEVKFKGGGKNRGSASIWSWKHNDCDSDIIAYRVIENDGREG